jgi:hypothetical protein
MVSSIGRFSHDLRFLFHISGFPPIFSQFPNRFPKKLTMENYGTTSGNWVWETIDIVHFPTLHTIRANCDRHGEDAASPGG